MTCGNGDGIIQLFYKAADITAIVPHKDPVSKCKTECSSTGVYKYHSAIMTIMALLAKPLVPRRRRGRLRSFLALDSIGLEQGSDASGNLVLDDTGMRSLLWGHERESCR